ncbi:uncharacterized protein LOC131257367 [Magnolia sinica]|uniref:uncharacterized protein LOC131257367 n=1 Tax=Magnolia sinica TaxID=86752 RepID=UPI002658FE8C|nr:uncharacterized protein LOC131257367 [Magnolia sinica]
MAQFLPHEQGNSRQDIENGGVHDPWPSGIQGNPTHLNIPQPSSEMIIAIIAMEWMIIAFLLSINIPINGDDGNNVLTILFHHHPMSFYFIVMIGVVAFYFTSWMWMMMIAGRFQPPMARILILVVLVLGVLAITVSLNALIPKFSWIVWIFFAPIIWVMLDMQGCEWATQLTVKIGKPVEEGCKWATQWTTDKIRSLYGDRFCCLPIRSPSCRTTQTVAVILIIIFI